MLELVYVHDTNDIYNYENPHDRSHWLLLADLLSRMSNLQFLAVDIRDFPAEESEDEDDVYESDPEETEIGEDGNLGSIRHRG